jgi:hypothetical protein
MPDPRRSPHSPDFTAYLLYAVSLIALAACASMGNAQAIPATRQPAPTVVSTTAPELTRPAATASPSPRGDADAPLMSLYRHGGLCASGACEWTFTLQADGTAAIVENSGTRIDALVSQDRMAQLRALIEQTDFAAIKALPFTDTCPTAYDGQESIYTFQTSRGQEVLAGCEVVIDPALPLFRWIDDLVASIQAG